MVVVVVVVVVGLGVVVVGVVFKSSEMSIGCAPCCCRIFSMLNGVVDTVGQPVNSVVALTFKCIE